MFPSTGSAVIDPLMNDFLHILGIGMTTDNADLKFKGVEGMLTLAQKREAAIRPTCVRTITANQRFCVRILRGVNTLTESNLPAFHRPRIIDDWKSFRAPTKQAGQFVGG